MSDLASKAEALRALHRRGTPVVLPNAWDVTSARAFAAAGFTAIATTSGGIAASLGYPDGEKIPADEMLGVVRRIASAVDVPVTADLEAGYGMAGAELIEALLSTGAVGLNHEDTDHTAGETLRPVGVQAERIAALKDAARSAGVDVVVNARVDVYLQESFDGSRDDEAVARGRAYRDGGADCVFPILCVEEASLQRLVREIDAPINAYARKGMPSIARLASLGVARISFGGNLMRTALLGVEAAARGLRDGAYPWD